MGRPRKYEGDPKERHREAQRRLKDARAEFNLPFQTCKNVVVIYKITSLLCIRFSCSHTKRAGKTRFALQADDCQEPFHHLFIPVSYGNLGYIRDFSELSLCPALPNDRRGYVACCRGYAFRTPT